MRFLIVVAGLLVAPFAVGAIATWRIAASVEARYPPLGRFVAVTGGRLHVLEEGPRSAASIGTVVFLHGASSSLADPMLALGHKLAEHARVIAIDRPGHGWSDRIGGAEAASPGRQAAIIAEALAALGVDKAVVVGHSWAGAILPNLALDHAGRVAATLYLAPVTHPWPGGKIAAYYGPAAAPGIGWLLTRTLATPAAAMMIDAGIASVFAPLPPAAGYREAAQVPLVLRPSAFQANAQDVSGLYDAVSSQQPRYRDIRLPTTIISGDSDPIVWTDIHSRGLTREVPGAKLIVLPGVGHMPHHAAPDLVIAEIEALAAAARADASAPAPRPGPAPAQAP